MEFFLATVKISGIIIAGLSGILGTITETHDEKTVFFGKNRSSSKVKRTLSRWGWASLILTVCGTLIALAAQIGEIWQKQQDDDESRKRTEKQISQANTMLLELQDQSKKSRTLLQTVELQNSLAKDTLNAISTQSFQTAIILTNVEVQSVIAKKSLDSLTAQADQSASILMEVREQGEIAHKQLEQSIEQNELNQSTLDGIQRLITPIDFLDIQVVLELEADESTRAIARRVLDLSQPALHRAEKETEDDIESDFLSPDFFFRPIDFMSISTRKNEFRRTLEGTPEISPTVLIEGLKLGDGPSSFQSRTILAEIDLPINRAKSQNAFLRQIPELSKRALAELANPYVQLRALLSNDVATVTASDDEQSTTLVGASLRVDAQLKNLLVCWSFRAKGFRWEGSHRRASVMDLDGVQLFLTTYQPFYPFGSLKPVKIEVASEGESLLLANRFLKMRPDEGDPSTRLKIREGVRVPRDLLLPKTRLMNPAAHQLITETIHRSEPLRFVWPSNVDRKRIRANLPYVEDSK